MNRSYRDGKHRSGTLASIVYVPVCVCVWGRLHLAAFPGMCGDAAVARGDAVACNHSSQFSRCSWTQLGTDQGPLFCSWSEITGVLMYADPPF